MKRWMLGAAAVAFAAHAAAADVSGTLVKDGQTLRVSHVVAHLHDNAEGLFGAPLTLVFADRPIPAGALVQGDIAQGAEQLARQGALLGVMVRMDPAVPTAVTLVVLMPTGDPREPLDSVSDSSNFGPPVIEGLRIADGRISGRIERRDLLLKTSVRFDTPLLREPAVVADLKGAAAKASPPYKAQAAYVAAMARGDVAATRQLASRGLRKHIDAMAADAGGDAALGARMKADAASDRASLEKVGRIVDRGSRATLIFGPGNYFVVVKEDGAWRVD